ncbi:conjugative transposon protein TraM [Chitinophaga defluvii]|uniref:Conjugative transposon protein TraM n=1 Tax=Chitinophaga defluvii TaxID=3163343 RepID=A0ABV2TEJ0_9BACT
MKTLENNPEEKQRKFLLFLPLLTVPFILLIAWAFSSSPKEEKHKPEDSKVNMALPDATFDGDRPQDKMSFYAKAEADSNRRSEQNKNDPYLNSAPIAGGSTNFNPYGPQGMNPSLSTMPGYTDPREAQMYRKLSELNTALNQPSPVAANPFGFPQSSNGASSVSKSDLDRLENMMAMMQQGSASGDPEMQQINSMLEKIVDIQHPELAKDKLKNASEQTKGKIYAVTAKNDDNVVTVMNAPVAKKSKQPTQADFYSLPESAIAEQANTISAVVHDNQTIVSGSIVKMRLTSDIMIRGELVPKDNFVFGQAQINGERLTIEINSIRHNGSIYPVNLSVCDMDGMQGIHIPGAITRDIAKENGTDALQGLGINSFDPNLATQAASAGIELSKNLIKKKVKLVKITLKAGYKLLLKDDKQEQIN